MTDSPTSRKRFHIGSTSDEHRWYVLDTGRAGMTMCRCYNEAQAKEIAAALERTAVETTPSRQAPIASVDVRADGCYSVSLLARRLPPGQYPLYSGPTEPESAGPKRAYYETHEPPHCPTCGCDRGPAICPHGFPLAENVCGPCSKGEPNRPPLKAGESHE